MRMEKERWRRRDGEGEGWGERDGGGEGGIRAYLSSPDGGRLGAEKRDQTRISRG